MDRNPIDNDFFEAYIETPPDFMEQTKNIGKMKKQGMSRAEILQEMERNGANMTVIKTVKILWEESDRIISMQTDCLAEKDIKT